MCWTRVAASLVLLLPAVAKAANLTITVTHDALPEETSWSFTNVDSGMELFRQDNGTWTTQDPVNQTVTFVDLAVNGTYQFYMEDMGMNGICCANGDGMITFSNETNDDLYQHNGNFTDKLKIYVHVDEEGYVSSFEPRDPEWPGVSGTATQFSFTVNVRFQSNPQNTTVEIWQKDDTYFNPGWHRNPILWYSGVAADAGTLWHRTLDNVDHGLYFLRISGGDIGWATVTNHTDVVWQVGNEAYAANNDQADLFMIVKGYHGYTIETVWDGNGDPPPGY